VRSVAEWIEVLGDAGVPCAPVNDIDAALTDRQAPARRAVVEYDHPVLGPVRTVASPYGEALTRPPTRAPLLGEHDEDALDEQRPGAIGE
jgi:formyl-CoA transferase/CoA:oxalate CoA-transferase